MSSPRLFAAAPARISAAMRALYLLPLLPFLAGPALAQSKPPAKPAAKPAPAANGPKSIGKFDDWQAVTHVEGGQTVCYTFARVLGSVPAVPGRGDVLLTVTQRPGSRDAVSLTAGFAYAASASVAVQIDAVTQEFYTDKRAAFSREGAAAVAAMQKGNKVVAKSPGPKNATVTDTFSLRGFSQAYAAISKACPPK